MDGRKMNKKQLEEVIDALTKGLNEARQKNSAKLPESANLDDLIKYMVGQREETNRMLARLSERMKVLEETVVSMGNDQAADVYPEAIEVPLSPVEKRIINFVETQKDQMACAEEVRKFMGYKGNNAACTKLKRLETLQLLTRYQMGHKVYYKVSAGKATMPLILSPPQ